MAAVPKGATSLKQWKFWASLAIILILLVMLVPNLVSRSKQGPGAELVKNEGGHPGENAKATKKNAAESGREGRKPVEQPNEAVVVVNPDPKPTTPTSPKVKIFAETISTRAEARVQFREVLHDIRAYWRMTYSPEARQGAAWALNRLSGGGDPAVNPAAREIPTDLWSRTRSKDGKAPKAGDLRARRKELIEKLESDKREIDKRVVEELSRSDLEALKDLKAAAQAGQAAVPGGWGPVVEVQAVLVSATDEPIVRELAPLALAQAESLRISAAQRVPEILAQRAFELIGAMPKAEPEAVAKAIREDELDLTSRFQAGAEAEVRAMIAAAGAKGTAARNAKLTLGEFFRQQKEETQKSPELKARIEGEWARFLGRLALRQTRAELKAQEAGGYNPTTPHRPFFGDEVGNVIGPFVQRLRDGRGERLALALKEDGKLKDLARREKAETVPQLRERIEVQVAAHRAESARFESARGFDAAFEAAWKRAEADSLAVRLENRGRRPAAEARRTSVLLDDLAAWLAPPSEEIRARLADKEAFPALRAVLDESADLKAQLEKLSENERLDRAVERLRPACEAFEALQEGDPRLEGFRLLPDFEKATSAGLPDDGLLSLRLPFEVAGLVEEAGLNVVNRRHRPTGIRIEADVIPSVDGPIIERWSLPDDQMPAVRTFIARVAPWVGSPDKPPTLAGGRIRFDSTHLAKIPDSKFQVSVVLMPMGDESKDSWSASGKVNAKDQAEFESAIRKLRQARLTQPGVAKTLAEASAQLMTEQGPQLGLASVSRWEGVDLVFIRFVGLKSSEIPFKIGQDGSVALGDFGPIEDDDLARQLAKVRWKEGAGPPKAMTGGGVRARGGAFEFRPRFETTRATDDDQSPRIVAAGPWLGLLASSKPTEEGTSFRLPGGLPVRAVGAEVGAKGAWLDLAAEIDGQSLPVGRLDLDDSPLFRPWANDAGVIDPSRLLQSAWDQGARQLPGLLPGGLGAVPAALPTPDVLPPGSATLTDSGALILKVGLGAPIDRPVEIGLTGDRWHLADAADLAARLPEIGPKIKARAAEVRGRLDDWFRRSHPLKLGGLDVELVVDPLPPVLGPVAITGRGTVRIAERALRVRVESAVLDHLPRSGEAIETLIRKGSLQLGFEDPSGFLGLIPGADDLARLVGLRVATAKLTPEGWRVSGAWTPPGSTEPIPFECASGPATGEELARLVLTALVRAQPAPMARPVGPVTFRLKSTVDDSRPPAVTFQGQVALASPIALNFECEGLRLALAGGRWSWTGPTKFSLGRADLKRLEAEARAAVGQIGLGTALSPGRDAVVPIELRDMAATLLRSDGGLDPRVEARLFFKEAPARDLARDGVRFAVDRGGFRIELDSLVAQLREELVKRTSEEIKRLGRIPGTQLQDWLDHALRGVRPSDFCDLNSGVITDPGRLSALLRRPPLDLGPLRVRITRVHRGRFYLLETDRDGTALARFEPIVPNRVEYEVDGPDGMKKPLRENDEEFRLRQEAYSRRLEEVKGHLEQFAVEVDAEVILPGGAVVEVGVPAVPGQGTRGAFRLDRGGLRVSPNASVGLEGRPSAWIGQLARGSAGADVSAVASMAEALPVEVRVALTAGPPDPDGWRKIDPTAFGLAAECLVTKAGLAAWLGRAMAPGSVEPALTLARVTVDAKGFRVDLAPDREKILAALAGQVGPMRLEVGPLRLAITDLAWVPGGVEASGKVEGLLSAVALALGGEAGPAADEPAVTFRGVRLRPSGPDLEGVQVDASALGDRLASAFSGGLLGPIQLGGVQARLIRAPEVSLRAIRFGVEARLRLLDAPLVVAVDPIEVRFEKGVAVSVGGARVAAGALIRQLGQLVGDRVDRLLRESAPIGIDGPLSFRLVRAGFNPDKSRVFVVSTLGVEGVLDPIELPPIELDGDGRITFDPSSLWVALKPRLVEVARARLMEVVGRDEIWKALKLGGVQLEPVLEGEASGRVLSLAILATADGGALEIGPVKVPLNKTRVATVRFDLERNAFEVKPEAILLEELGAQLAGQVADALKERFGGQQVKVSILGQEFFLDPRWDKDRKEVVVDLVAKLRGRDLVDDSGPGHGDQVRVGPIVLTGLSGDPKPNFSRVKVDNGDVLARWLVLSTGLDEYLKIRSLRASGGQLAFSGTIQVPGYLDPVDLDLTIPLEGGREAWIPALVNPLLAQWQGDEFRLADGIKLRVESPRLGRVSPDVELGIGLKLTILESPNIVVPATLLVSSQGVRIAEGADALGGLIEAQVKGVLGTLVSELAAVLTDDALKLEVDVRNDGRPFPIGFVANGKLNLGALGLGFGEASLSFRGLTILANKVEAPSGFGLTIPVTIPAGPISLYDPGGEYDNRDKVFRIKTKISISPGRGPGDIIHFNATQSIPLAKITRLQSDGSIVLFHIPIATSTGVLDFEAMSISQSFETAKLFGDVLKLKGDVVLDFKNVKVAGELLVRLLSCDVAKALLLIDLAKKKVQVSGDVNLYIARVYTDFRLENGLDDPRLNAGTSASLPLIGKVAELAIDLSVRRAQVLAQILVFKAMLYFPTAMLIDPVKIAEALLARIIHSLLGQGDAGSIRKIVPRVCVHRPHSFSP